MTITEGARVARLERLLLKQSRSLDREIAWFKRCLSDQGRPAVSLDHQMIRAQHAQETRQTLDRLMDARGELDVELGAMGLLGEAGRPV